MSADDAATFGPKPKISQAMPNAEDLHGRRDDLFLIIHINAFLRKHLK